MLHYLTMFLMGINFCVLLVLFFRYRQFRNKEVPGLNYCLAILVISIIFGVFATAALLLPEGDVLTWVVIGLSGIGVLTNTFFTLIIVTLIGAGNSWIFRHKKLLLFAPLVLVPIFLTNPWHHWIVEDVAKSSDAFLYHATYGLGMVVVSIYSVLLILFAIVHVFRSRSKGLMNKPWLRWLLVICSILPACFGGLEQGIPVLRDIGLQLFTPWISISIIIYLFFGYLFSARHNALDNIADAYVVFDLNGYCVDTNKEAVEFFEKYCGSSKPTPNDLEALTGMKDLTGQQAHEFVLPSDTGSCHYRISAFQLSSGLNQYCGNGYIIREITEFVDKMSELESIAIKDPLTGAKNRRYLEEAAESILSSAAQHMRDVSVLMLDLDHFKRVNDTYGHMVGDEVLVGTYRIIYRNVRKSDVIVRYGGEEFLVLCGDMGYDQARNTAERIRKGIEEQAFETTAGVLRITVSIGVFNKKAEAGDRIDQYIERADERLYTAKNNGRNRVE